MTKKEEKEIGADSEFLPKHEMPEVPKGATDSETTSYVAGSAGAAGGLPAVTGPTHQELPEEAPEPAPATKKEEEKEKKETARK